MPPTHARSPKGTIAKPALRTNRNFQRPPNMNKDKTQTTILWRGIIRVASANVLALFALIVLVGEGSLSIIAALAPSDARGPIFYTMVGLLGTVISAVTLLGSKNPQILIWNRNSNSRPRALEVLNDHEKKEILELNKGAVEGADAPPLSPDKWTIQLHQLRSVLYQSSRYAAPAYYLDTNLNIIDWNVAFEVIFQRILHKIRMRHVNHFIAELMNAADVFDRARDFTEQSRRGELPLVHIEPLIYDSGAYGIVEFEKVACQLNDPNGDLKAWAVCLMLKQIQWETFRDELRRRLREHKLWSIYAASYDAILLEFPLYRELLSEVIQGVPLTERHVLDLGAGTGNVTRMLLERGHRVTALENNQPMIEKFLAKKLDATGKLVLNKGSAENFDSLKPGSFDSVVSVNVLYALNDPAGCIRNVARILRPEGPLRSPRPTLRRNWIRC
jgi:2-polyprenyl-3-methyl-5-hydroxy-6-metoxy-1,4-benzoquinol methylase